MAHYVGVSGIGSADELDALASLFWNAGFSGSSHVPMAGVLISRKGLSNEASKNRRYVTLDQLGILLRHGAGIEKMVHYGTPDASTLVEQVVRLMSGFYDSGLCRRLQLNVDLPSRDDVCRIKERFPELSVVLPCSPMSASAEAVAGFQQYAGLVDGVLIDSSQGTGSEFDVGSAYAFYRAFKTAMPAASVGFAGGLDGANVQRKIGELSILIGGFGFNIDAEGRLRDKLSNRKGDDVLNLSKTADYIRGASVMLQRA
ncbi:hypothetical protein HY489_00410 [Candidatus Woesearchaeota archaeon]|nr:hypothetical protein [Candidatus Woesearchaeota archaeon]